MNTQVLGKVRLGYDELIEKRGSSRGWRGDNVARRRINQRVWDGSFSGVPFTSVPKGAGLDAVAEDDEVSGSVIW